MSKEVSKVERKAIKPVRMVLEVEASEINANGSYCGWRVIGAKAVDNKEATMALSVSLMYGTAIYVKASSLAGLSVMGDVGKAEKQKLF